MWSATVRSAFILSDYIIDSAPSMLIKWSCSGTAGWESRIPLGPINTEGLSLQAYQAVLTYHAK